MKELICPQCGSNDILIERRPDGYMKCGYCFRSWKNTTGTPIESQKPPFQSEPFPGYVDSLKSRIAELEHAFKRVQHILGPDYMIAQATGIPLPEDRLFAIYEIVEEMIGGKV